MSKPNSVKSWIKENKLLAGLILFLGLWFFISLVPSSDSSQITQSITTNGTDRSAQVKNDIIILSLNEEADLGPYTLSVLSYEESDVLVHRLYGSVKAKEGAKFVTVELEVVNQTNEEFLFFPDKQIVLQDNLSRQFETYDDTIGSADDYLNVRELGPAIRETGILIYEIPEDVPGYALIGGSTDGTIYSIPLQMYAE